MQTGHVKWFNKEKGYGFIQPENSTGQDIFIHSTAVERSGLNSLDEGQYIEFESVEDPRKGKPTASRVKLIKQMES